MSTTIADAFEWGKKKDRPVVRVALKCGYCTYTFARDFTALDQFSSTARLGCRPEPVGPPSPFSIMSRVASVVCAIRKTERKGWFPWTRYAQDIHGVRPGRRGVPELQPPLVYRAVPQADHDRGRSMSPRRHILDDVDAIVPDDKHRNEHVISIDCPDCAIDDDRAEAKGLRVTKPHGRRTAIDGACSKCCNRSWSPAGGMTVADRLRIKGERA